MTLSITIFLFMHNWLVLHIYLTWSKNDLKVLTMLQKTFHYLLLNVTKLIFFHKNVSTYWQENLSGSWQHDCKGLGSRSLYTVAFKPPWIFNTHYKAFFLILSHLGGFWQKASEPSKLGVLCIARKKSTPRWPFCKYWKRNVQCI